MHFRILTRVVIVSLVMGLNASAFRANAADWWLVNDGLSNLKASSDADSLLCSKGKCKIWERTVYSKVRSDKVAFQLDLAEYDCVGFETATLEEKSFASDGTLTKDVKSTKIEWQPVAEDTLGEALLTFACMYKVNKTSGRASGLMEIDQRQFVRQNVEISIGKGAMIAVSKLADPIVAAPKLQQEIAVLPGTLGVQLLAADRMAVAQASLDNLQKAHVSWLRSLYVGVDPVSLKGKTIYRAVIRGFNSTGEAIALCRTLRTAGYDCLVRRPAKSSQG